MSNTGKYRDTAPNLPAAGKTQAVRADTAAACFSTVERPPTPDEIRRFRKTSTGGTLINDFEASRSTAFL